MKKVIDYPLFIITIALTFFGIFMILSATYYANINGISENPLVTFNGAVKEAAIGIAFMIFTMFFKAKWLKDLSPYLLLFSVGLLIATLFIGIERGSAKRWLAISTYSFATAEFAKVASIFYFARVLSKINNSDKAYKNAWINLGIFGSLSAFLILKQPDLGTTFVYCSIIGIMLFVSGAKIRHILILVLCGVLIFLIAIKTSGYRSYRLDLLLNNEITLEGGGAQATQSKLSIAEGELFGVGVGRAYQTKNAMSQSESDYIFANIAETTGFLGSVVLMFAYVFFLWRCIIIALKAETAYASLVVVGVVSMVMLQALLHLSVNVGFMPPTGMILPFISSGGTSVVMLLGSVGVVLNLSSNPQGLEE